MARAERRRVAEETLGFVGLADVAGQTIYELSGRMQQRVGIARAVASDPRLLLMEEPFGALDSFTWGQSQELILRTWHRTGKMAFFITYDVEGAVFLATKLVIMSPRPGRIIEMLDLPFSCRFIGGEGARPLRANPDFITMRDCVLDRVHHRDALASENA